MNQFVKRQTITPARYEARRGLVTPEEINAVKWGQAWSTPCISCGAERRTDCTSSTGRRLYTFHQRRKVTYLLQWINVISEEPDIDDLCG